MEDLGTKEKDQYLEVRYEIYKCWVVRGLCPSTGKF